MDKQKKAYIKPEAIFVSSDSQQYREIMRLLQENGKEIRPNQTEEKQK